MNKTRTANEHIHNMRQKIRDLSKTLHVINWYYWIQNQHIISDAEYQEHKSMLLRLESKFPFLREEYSPTELHAIDYDLHFHKTKILDITWIIKGTGKLKPTLTIQPIEAHQHTFRKIVISYEDFQHNNLKIGDTILLSIFSVTPRFIQVIQPNTATSEKILPKCCPECGTPLEIDSKALKCPNKACHGRKLAKILRYIKYRNLGPLTAYTGILRILVKSGILTHYLDLYKLNFGILSHYIEDRQIIQTILHTIYDTRNYVSLERMLLALQIPGLDKHHCKRLNKKVYSATALLEKNADELSELLNPYIASKIVLWKAELSEERWKLLLEYCHQTSELQKVQMRSTYLKYR